MNDGIDLQTYDPLDRAAQQDPFPYYAELRSQAPVYRHPASGLYFVSTMDAIIEVLGAPRLYSSRSSKPSTPPEGAIVDQLKAIAAEGYRSRVLSVLSHTSHFFEPTRCAQAKQIQSCCPYCLDQVQGSAV